MLPTLTMQSSEMCCNRTLITPSLLKSLRADKSIFCFVVTLITFNLIYLQTLRIGTPKDPKKFHRTANRPSNGLRGTRFM